MTEDIDWTNPSTVIDAISNVISPANDDEDYDVFDDIEHIGWMINKHYEALRNQ